MGEFVLSTGEGVPSMGEDVLCRGEFVPDTGENAVVSVGGAANSVVGAVLTFVDA